MLKRTRGAATQGLYMCDDIDEMIKSIQEALKNDLDTSAERSKLLLQERINGREHIVNTASSNGDHRLVSIWEYDKLKMPNGTNAYNYCESVNQLKIGHSRLVRYAFDTVDAIGI